MNLKRHATGLVIALLATLGGCDQDEAPAEGSCQAMVSEAIENDDDETSCWAALGVTSGTPDTPESAARCVASLFDLEEPPEGTINGEAYQVAYRALCDIHGDDMPQYCEISSSLGCEG